MRQYSPPVLAQRLPKACSRKQRRRPSSACGNARRLTIEVKALQRALPALQCLRKRNCTCLTDVIACRIPATHKQQYTRSRSASTRQYSPPILAQRLPKACSRKQRRRPSSACGKARRLTLEVKALQRALPALQCLRKRNCTCLTDAIVCRIPATHKQQSHAHSVSIDAPLQPSSPRTAPTGKHAAGSKGAGPAARMRQGT